MALRFGLNVWALTAPADNSILPLFDQVKAMGFDSIELPVEAVGVLDARKVAAKLKETGLHGIACGVFGPDRDLTNDDPTVRRNCLNYAKGALKFAEAIGANRLIGPMYAAVGKRRMVSAEQKKIEWERAVKGLRQAGQVAADRGVVIAILDTGVSKLNGLTKPANGKGNRIVGWKDFVDGGGNGLVLWTLFVGR